MKYKLLLPILAAFLCLATRMDAQIQFSKEYGGAYNEDGRWMEQLPDSGFIMTGGTNTYSNGQTDIWLVRADAYGNQLWTQSIGGTAYDFGNMVKRTTDNGFIIAGFTNSYGAGDNDGWLVKTDVNGNTLWSTTSGDAGIQEFEGVVQTTDGGYAAVGISYGTGTAYYDIYLVKFNSAGVEQWSKFIGGASFEIGNAIQQTADGGFIITGQTYSYGNADGDYYLVKTDDLGVTQWENWWPQNGLQEAHYVQITPDGGYIIVGDADSLTNGLGDTDIELMRTDANGDSLWTKTLGGNKKDGGKTVENTSDGGFIIAGITRSFGLINPNYYLVKTDDAGTVQWTNSTYGSVYHDHAYRGIETSDGGFAEVGFFRNASGFMNFSLVKLGPNGGVTKDVAIDEITIPSPNICRNNNVPFAVKLTNYGATTENNFIVNIDVNNGTTTTTLTDTMPGSLVPGASAILSFDPTYNFNVDGMYTLTAYMAHRSSDISYSNDTNSIEIEVHPPTLDPWTVSAISCSGSIMGLQANPQTADDSLFWYDAAVNGNLVNTGELLVTPALSSSTTYYVESIQGKGSMVGPADNSIGNGSYSNSGYLKFDSRVPFKLVSVKVYASSAGNRIIELRNSSGTVLQSKTINLPVGASRVYLNFDIPQGNDFRLGLGAGSGTLFRNSDGAVFTYSVSKTVEIYGTSSNNTGTYYYFYDWYVFVPYQDCASNRIPAYAIVGTSATTAFDNSRCGTGMVTLFANSGDVLNWYSASTGGASLGTGSTFLTPSISTSTTYYLEVGSCPNRIPVLATVNSTSTSPAASNVTNCGPGIITLTASATDPIFWYDDAVDGVLVGTGTSFTTPYLSATQTYYVSAGVNCPSPRIAVQAIINAALPPVVSNVTACGPTSVILTATSPDPVSWYSSPTGGTPLATTYNFNTPILANSAVYYAQAVSACPSPRVPVTATIVVVDPPVGTGASHCGPGSLVLSAQSIYTVSWWSAGSGGVQLSSGLIFTTPSLSTTTTYYAQAANQGCTSTRSAVVANISGSTAPSASAVAHCGPGIITLTATSADTIYWFSAASGGTLLATGSTYTTPYISSTTPYYAQASLSCPSPRIAVDAIITTIPADPTVNDTSICGAGTAILNAASADPITWYSSPGGTVLGTGNSFTTPSISTTTTYYAAAGITGCQSTAIPGVVTVNSVPSNPVTTGAVNCGPGSLTLSATSPGTLTWFAQASGGVAIGSGNSYNSTFAATTTVYVEASNGTCTSSRVPVTATIYTLPVVNLGPSVVNIQSGTTITLDAGAGYISYLWNTLATTQTITTGTAGTYYVTVTDNHTCHGYDTITVNVYIGINDPALEQALQVFPNPTVGLFQISVTDHSLNFNLKITDALGNVILTDVKKENAVYTKSFDLSSQPAGVYFLVFSNEKSTLTKSIVVE